MTIEVNEEDLFPSYKALVDLLKELKIELMVVDSNYVTIVYKDDAPHGSMEIRLKDA